MESSLYKFTLKDDNSGTFQVIAANQQTIKIAFNSPETYLERACTYKNALNPGAHTSIKTDVPGVFTIEDDSIIVKDKAVIEFL
jgi:hypothetical protein